MSKIANIYGQDCSAMSSGKYCNAAVTNVESVLEERGLRIPSKCVTPMSCGYRPYIDVTGELRSDGVQWYQELLVTLKWAV